jgi:hypothetical protein
MTSGHVATIHGTFQKQVHIKNGRLSPPVFETTHGSY